ncbi:hypothetical protein ACFP63_07680 [Oerskovia jenensis]|uniref:ABC transporter ATP-binding protein n=2 Tax=Oerskovia jenensis TaxID=162169 RepID=A0ABS2LIG5_9CELL|nr:hypothetical protein [Oerskovia jenensis]MBM7479929.1 hypothetical protein [Oerskovia jenensis]
MQIAMDDVQVEGRRSPMLEATTLTLASGECVLLAGEPGHGHTALALVATGRLAPYTGTVTLVDDDGTTSTSTADLRRVTAVVDVPGISEPDEALTVGDVVAEELSLAGQRSLPGHAKRWLDAHDLLDRRGDRVDELHGALRTALLSSLASEREDVRFLVLTLPDRHRSEPSNWWSVAESLAALGYGVLVQCTRSSARDLGADLPPARGDDALRAAPVEALRTRPAPAVAEVPAVPNAAAVAGEPAGPDEARTAGATEPAETTDPTDPTLTAAREAPGRHQATTAPEREPEPEPEREPDPGPDPGPGQGSAADPATDPATDPAADPATDPAADPATEPPPDEGTDR